MKAEFGFGSGTQTVEIPARNFAGTLLAKRQDVKPRGEAALRQALAQPLGAPRLRELLRPGERIAIITSDITRPCPSARMLPLLLDEIYSAGAAPQAVTLVFALGSHRPHTEAERAALAGARAMAEIRCIDSDPGDVLRLGTTRRGTPVDITRVVAEADRRICLGNIEYHYFAGYSGGAKALMPGCSSRAAIQSNHCFMVEESACAGRLDGNPVREDIEEALRFCPVDFILNVVLDEHKEIVHAVAGDVIAAHRAGCRFLDALYRVELPGPADIVLASQGGAPKDINLYQLQKALDNAKHAVRPGGIIILIGSCREGLGERVFEEWMTSAASPQALIERIGRDFQLGGHKAAAIAMTLQKADIYLVSELAPDFVRRLFLTPYTSAQTALDDALRRLGAGAAVLAMPYGGSTLPCLAAARGNA